MPPTGVDGELKGAAKNSHILRSIFSSPARVPMISYAGLILIGTLLLMLPVSVKSGGLGFIDALFTAVSATCVTGLTVVDTGTTFSIFGQMTILAMIQIGGLGIMTFSTVFIMLASGRLTLSGRLFIQDAFTHSGQRGLTNILLDVLLFTAFIELAGSVLLFFYFLPQNGALESLYQSVFHSVSAFCNAGFSLFPESFTAYGQDWVFNLVVCLLIISGGIGFLVLSELKRQFPINRRRWHRLSLHSKIVLSTTGCLIVFGTVLILAMEWQNTLSPLSVPGRVIASFFQAVTTRTAGFNTLPISAMANETLFTMMMLMFIGGSPGSCAGGIKTTTFASLMILGISRMRGKSRPQAFHRTISQVSIGKAVSVVLMSAVVVVMGTLILLMTELGEISHMKSRGKFLELFFEVVSAFGTVGLSAGATTALSDLGKIFLSLVMFTGRLGPLMIAIAVSRRETSRHYYAEEVIMTG